MHVHRPKTKTALLVTVVVCLLTQDVAAGYLSDESARAEVCHGEPCESQTDCCAGTVCIADEDDERTSLLEGFARGKCVRLAGQSEGQPCVRGMHSCRGEDLRCLAFDERHDPLGVCVNPNSIMKRKDYFSTCERTIDCDLSENLCCREHREGKKKSRRICSYFENLIDDCVF